MANVATLSGKTPVQDNLFVVPVLNQFLIYAPFHNLAALVDHTAVLRLRESLFSSESVIEGQLGELVHILQAEAEHPPQPRQGELAPAFLGLLPTRGCNLACRYCGFLTASETNRIMGLKLARDAVDWYMGLVGQSGQGRAEVHYFGGEPFCAQEVVDLTVHMARIRAEAIGVSVRFEVATNGAFSQERCQWVADNMDTVVLSLDGPADIQDRHRPYQDGRGTFETVTHNATILSEGATDLFFRSCVTAQTVDRMPEVAAWFCENFCPRGVCFEPIQPTAQSKASQLEPPDPWSFARSFLQAAEILEAHGVEPVYAAADIQTRRVSFCPVGRDVAIVSPDGAINDDGAVALDKGRLASIRRLNVWNKPFCARCFCQWHCAGGCHVNHTPPNSAGDYDRLCLQTRTIALRNILKAMGRQDLIRELLREPEAMERAVRQVSDILVDLEERS
jgi:uncharacterized protein